MVAPYTCPRASLDSMGVASRMAKLTADWDAMLAHYYNKRAQVDGRTTGKASNIITMSLLASRSLLPVKFVTGEPEDHVMIHPIS